MKKIVYLFVLLLSFSSCDDGELTLESFNFENVDIQDCETNFLIFKTKNDELLLVSLLEDDYNDLFIPEVTSPNEPRTKDIQGNIKVIYRKYSGNVSNGTICDLVPPSSPVVTKEWLATGGKISVITTELVNATNDVTGHTHNITFTNVNFISSDNSFSFESYIFGNYEINL